MNNTHQNAFLAEDEKGQIEMLLRDRRVSHMEDALCDLNEELADTYAAHYPDEEDFEGPTICLPDGTGYELVIQAIRVGKDGKAIAPASDNSD